MAFLIFLKSLWVHPQDVHDLVNICFGLEYMVTTNLSAKLSFLAAGRNPHLFYLARNYDLNFNRVLDFEVAL